MAQAQPTARDARFVIVLTVLAAVAYVVTGLVLTARSSYYGTSYLWMGPILFLISLPILARQARREGDRRLFHLLMLALALKLLGALLRHYVIYEVYRGVGDATGYDRAGQLLSEQFRGGDFSIPYPRFDGTVFIRVVTGVLYTIIGSGRLAGFLVYSWLAFWGLFFFYRAFVIAMPEGRSRTYARLLFFFPSLLYWPSSIGKEAWMVFTIGIAAFGAAQVLSGRTWRGLGVAALGMWLGALVRPYVPGFVALGLGIAYLLRRPRRELRQLAPVAKAVGVVALGLLAVVVVLKAQSFLKADLSSPEGVVATLERVSKRSATGGSAFTPTVVRSPADLPLATVTVLFRPFPFEANNAQALAAALESTFLLVLSLFRIRWILSALRSFRRQPYVVLALIYTGLFIVAFSAFPNFGLLARERVQLLPFYFVLLAVPPGRGKGSRLAPEASSEASSGAGPPPQSERGPGDEPDRAHHASRA